MTSSTAPTITPARVVAGIILVIDALLLLVAAWFAIDTWQILSEPGDHGFAGLGYLVAMIAAGIALPSVPFAIAAIRTHDRVSNVWAALAILALGLPPLWLYLGW